MGFADYFDRNMHALSQALGADNFEKIKPLLEQHTIGVDFDDEGLRSLNSKVIVETIVRIISRLYPNVCILYHGTVEEGRSLQESMKRLAKEINPNINIEKDQKKVTAAICVGNSARLAFKVHVQADSWNLEVSKKGPTDKLVGQYFNPFSAVSAACFGAAEVFNHVFKEYLPLVRSDDQYVFSLLDLKWELSELIELQETTMDDVTLVGLGAVGNAACYSLGYMGDLLKGEANLIDGEKIELSNMQRYVSTRRISEGALKTTIGKDEFEKTRVNATMYNLSLGEYISQHQKDCRFNVMAISVDNADTRIYAQALLPRIVINGWTADQAGDYGELGVSRHWFDSEQACLACLYMPSGEVISELDKICSFTGFDKEFIVKIYRYPLDENILKQISEKKGYPSDIVMRWKGRFVRDFYIEAGCGGVMLGGHKEAGEHAAIVPIVHQSVLAGALLAAEIVKTMHGLTPRDKLASFKMSVFKVPYIYDMLKTPKDDRCICQDEDYLTRYRQKYERT